MNDELADRHAEALRETLGWDGRMIAGSKTGFRREHPDHAAIFNANVCLQDGKVWHGDLDLTLDEPLLLALAERIGETVYVLYEHDGRFEHEQAPLLARAVYSATPSAHTRFQRRYLERAADGSLRQRPPSPQSRRRLVFCLARPRLWRFWRAELIRRNLQQPEGLERSRLLYLGERAAPTDGTPRSPLLVLGLHRSERWSGIEWTWYPTRKRHAPSPLLKRSVARRRGHLRPYLALLVWPGFMYELRAGFDRKRSWP